MGTKEKKRGTQKSREVGKKNAKSWWCPTGGSTGEAFICEKKKEKFKSLVTKHYDKNAVLEGG